MKSNWRKHSGLLAVATLLAVGPAAANAAAASDTVTLNGPAGGSTGATATYYHWGFIWYIQGAAAYDTVTWVEGGAEGSSMLVYPAETAKNGTDVFTTWVLVDGTGLYLREPGLTKKTHTEEKGYLVRSKARDFWEKLEVTEPVQAHLAQLNSRLIELYKYSTDDPLVDPIRVIPYLVAAGWPDGKTPGPNGAPAPGAPLAYVEYCLQQMDLDLEFGSSIEDGFAIAQEPAPGTPWPVGEDPKVTVTFDGQAAALPPKGPGDTIETAIPIQSWDNKEDRAAVTWTSTDKMGRASCTPPNTGDARDVLFVWRDDTAPMRLKATVTWADPPDTILSAWYKNAKGDFVEVEPNTDTNDKTCDFAWPTLEFTAEQGCAYYIALEFARDANGTAKLEFAFTNINPAEQNE